MLGEESSNASKENVDSKSRTSHSSKKKDDHTPKRTPERKTGKENSKEKVKESSSRESSAFSKKGSSTISDTSKKTQSKSAAVSSNITDTDEILNTFLSQSKHSEATRDNYVVLTPEIRPPTLHDMSSDSLNTSFDLPLSESLRSRLGHITASVAQTTIPDTNVLIPPPPEPPMYDPTVPPLPGGFGISHLTTHGIPPTPPMSQITTSGIPQTSISPYITTGGFPQSSNPVVLNNPHIPSQPMLPHVMSLPTIYQSSDMKQQTMDSSITPNQSLQRAASTLSLSKDLSKSISDISRIGRASPSSITRTVVKPKTATVSEGDRTIQIVQSIDTLSNRKPMKKKSSLESIRIEKIVDSEETTGVNFEDVQQERQQPVNPDVQVKLVSHKGKSKKVCRKE